MYKFSSVVRKLRSCMAMLVMLALAGVAVADPIHVSINTSSLNGVQGAVEFQYGSFAGDAPGNAIVSNFTGGTIVGVPDTVGNVSGTISPGPLVLGNIPGLNDALQDFNFGNNLAFDVNLTGTGTFAVSLWNGRIAAILANGNANQLFQADPSGATLLVSVDRGHVGGITASPQVQAQVVPEPTSWIAFATIMSIAVAARRMSRAGRTRASSLVPHQTSDS